MFMYQGTYTQSMYWAPSGLDVLVILYFYIYIYIFGGAHNVMQLTWLAHSHQLMLEGKGPLSM